MVAKETAQSISMLLPAALRRAKQQSETLFVLQRLWGRLVGMALATHTAPMGLRRGRLIVHVDRPGDSFILSYQRQELLRRIQAVTRGEVEELVIRVGETRRAHRTSTRRARPSRKHALSD